MGKLMDLSGKTFGRLLVLSRHGTGLPVLWECVCECGKICTPSSQHLRTGHTKSCGCYGLESSIKNNTKHGMSQGRFYNIWCMLKRRMVGYILVQFDCEECYGTGAVRRQ
jgi:hypothetical protein